MDEIVSPFALSFVGKDADVHSLNSVYLGRSLVGAGRFYTAVAHYALLGAVPRGNYRKEFVCFSKAPREGSYEAWLFIATLAQQYDLHGAVYKHATQFILGKIVEAIKNVWTRPTKMDATVTALVDVLTEQARRQAEVGTILANGIIKANDNLASLHGKLIDKLPELAQATRGAGRELVSPVGITCTGLVQFATTPSESEINLPDAEVIKSQENLEVGEQVEQFRCNRIIELNLSNGHCILDIEGFEARVRGSITDPALQVPHSIYSSAMDSFTPIVIEAKRVEKDGELHRLYVSNARRIQGS